MSEHGEQSGEPINQDLTNTPDLSKLPTQADEATVPPASTDRTFTREEWVASARKRIQTLGVEHRLTSRHDPEHHAEVERRKQETLQEHGPDGETIFGAGTLYHISSLEAGTLEHWRYKLEIEFGADPETAKAEAIKGEYSNARKDLFSIAKTPILPPRSPQS